MKSLAWNNAFMTEKGEQIHKTIVNRGFLDNTALGNGLVDTYGKYGSLNKACELFDTLLVHNIVSWKSLIAGFSRGNCTHEVFI